MGATSTSTSQAARSAPGSAVGLSPEEARRNRLVITASSLGTVFEWYDFFVYGTLAVLLGRLFFPTADPTAALLLSLATFGAGFGVRPLGAIVFGVLGDRIGRKYTFLATITLMGFATAAVGFLPTFATIGLWAPALLVVLRLLQGLALGGEYGGAAIYVAEHAPPDRRGFYTSFIQASVVGGFILSLVVVLATTAVTGREAFEAWGWRIPFLFSIALLALSLWIRLKLAESPVFQAMKEEGAIARNPLKTSFGQWGNLRLMLIALFGVAAGLTVIWYTAQFSTLYFLQQTALVDETTSKLLIGTAALLSAPFFILFGRLSDKVGRKPVMLVGYGLTLLLLFPAFKLLAVSANPALVDAMRLAPVTLSGDECRYNPFAREQASDCGRALQFLTARGIAHERAEARPGQPLVIRVGEVELTGFDLPMLEATLAAKGYPTAERPGERSDLKIIASVLLLGILSAMTYGPVAALLVELFPANIRYTSMSIPYHIGTGYFGGFLPFVSQYIVATSGNVYGGLWYTWGVVAFAFLITLFFLSETRGRPIVHARPAAAAS